MNRTTTTIFVTVLVLLSAGMFACRGFDFGDYFTVATPVEIQQSDGLPARLPLNQAEKEYRNWADGVRTNATSWKESIGAAADQAEFLRSVTLQAFTELGPQFATMAGLPGMAGIIGLIAGRAGRGRDKEGSYNKGKSDGEKAVLAGIEKASESNGNDQMVRAVIDAVKRELPATE